MLFLTWCGSSKSSRNREKCPETCLNAPKTRRRREKASWPPSWQTRPAFSEEKMAKNLSNLRAPKKANTGRKRVGRGMGSGMGKTSTRGHKGQGSRSGSSLMRGFEGGQMPLHRRLPKRGFTNIFRTEYTVLNLDRIAQLQGEIGQGELTLEDFAAKGLLDKRKGLLKVLGNGDLTGAVTIHAHKFSKSAQEKIEKAGGKAILVAG
jgi:large subunit ribosomal protein L15